MGICAIRELGAPQATLAFSYLVGAVLAALTGYIGGHWSTGSAAARGHYAEAAIASTA